MSLRILLTPALAAPLGSDAEYRRTRLVQVSVTAGVASRPARTIDNREFEVALGWSSTLPPAAKIRKLGRTRRKCHASAGSSRYVCDRVGGIDCYTPERLSIGRR